MFGSAGSGSCPPNQPSPPNPAHARDRDDREQALLNDRAFTIYRVPRGCWRSVDVDADGNATRQVAEVDFARGDWKARGLGASLPFARWNARAGSCISGTTPSGPCRPSSPTTCTATPTSSPHHYDGRAGVEPLIGDLNGAWGHWQGAYGSFRGQPCRPVAQAAHAQPAAQIRARHGAALAAWRAPWLRRALLVVAGRFVRHGQIRISPQTMTRMSWRPRLGPFGCAAARFGAVVRCFVVTPN